MIGWNEGYNWTREQYKNVIEKARQDKKETISLDVEHSDSQNENDLLAWAREDGYQADLVRERVVIVF